MVFGKTNKQREAKCIAWRRWFAWYPVRLYQPFDPDGRNGQWVWLEVIERMGEFFSDSNCSFEYRLIGKS
jgi:hypothetical protein